MNAVNQFLSDLAERRTALAEERDRIGDLIDQVDAILNQYQFEIERKRTPAGATTLPDKEALRKEITRLCREAHPNGLTTEELHERIAGHWSRGDVSQRRIGTLAVHTAELAGNGSGPYYYVPAEGENMGQGGE